MARPQVLEGTWEELKLHESELAGKRFRLVPVLPDDDSLELDSGGSQQSTSPRTTGAVRHLTGMGKFAGIIPSSETFIKEKQDEIELEDRKFRS